MLKDFPDTGNIPVYESDNSLPALEAWVRKAILHCRLETKYGEGELRIKLLNAGINAVRENGAFRGDICAIWESIVGGRFRMREIFHSKFLYF